MGKVHTNEKYLFDCWVNGKSLQAYVDSGCGAVLITKSSVATLGLETTPCTELIMGYGGSSIEKLGKVKLNLKVDSAEAQVEALVVLNVTQNIPVLVSQTFLNNEIQTVRSPRILIFVLEKYHYGQRPQQ
ncbi:hypothetical protein RN001_011502 [Aquatica leii]|uniref:Peptidase A2 domain-containing protein n=1 Tax=Aquatica leii TaxID=1421715 RepID=A0AAN7NXG4_9COLE|nr:hypothetical protein RN001_011502 [Aquatica leii]